MSLLHEAIIVEKFGLRLTVEQLGQAFNLAPNTIHNRKWQERTGCPLIKIGKRLYAFVEEFWVWFKRGAIA